MDMLVETTLRSLRHRHLNGVFAKNLEDARGIIVGLIPKDAVVGIGDSATVQQTGVKEELKKRGTRVLDGFDRKTPFASVKDMEELRNRMAKESTMCDVFLTGTNALTQDGKLVNVDATGNRVAGMFWGHPTSIIVVGRNKIVKNIDEAFHRIRNVVAPNHIRIRSTGLGGRQAKTPCSITGKCNDCRTRDRRCNVFTIIESKPLRTDITVVIVDEDLGLGWDEEWPPERIAKIIENYKRFVWEPGHLVLPVVDKKERNLNNCLDK